MLSADRFAARGGAPCIQARGSPDAPGSAGVLAVMVSPVTDEARALVLDVHVGTIG